MDDQPKKPVSKRPKSKPPSPKGKRVVRKKAAKRPAATVGPQPAVPAAPRRTPKELIVAALVSLFGGMGYWAPLISGLLHAFVLLVLALITLQMANAKVDRRELLEVDTELDVRKDLFVSHAVEMESEPMLEKPAGPLRAATQALPDQSMNPNAANQALAGVAGAVFNPGDLLGGGPGAPGIGGSGEGEGVAGFFGASAKGDRICYVIDRSYSMVENSSMKLAIKELLRSLDNLSPNMYFQVVFYNTEPERLKLKGRDLAIANDVFRNKAREQIQAMKPKGGTDHGKALRMAVGMRPDVIFMLTDAEDAEPEMIEEITRLSGGGKSSKRRAPITIHVIQFHHDRHRAPDDGIRQLAEKNKGTYRMIDTNELAKGQS